MGISILIVDDDKLLVEKLEETVNWSGIGIDMVFTANNIRQAQKLLEDIRLKCCCVTLICHRATGWSFWNGSGTKSWISNVPS